MRKPRRLSREELAPYMVELPTVRGGRLLPGRIEPPSEGVRPLVWQELFGNDRPVEVEVGFGKGLFLVTTAQAHPERNYFGIEVVRKYQLYATTRIAIRKLTNVRTCCTDAKWVLRDLIPSGSVASVHVYFPDPWWKQRHKKRLLFTPDFAQSVARVLVPGGRLSFATDVPDYFEMVAGMLTRFPSFRHVETPADPQPTHDMDYLTNFERKARLAGKPIYRAVYERLPGPVGEPMGEAG